MDSYMKFINQLDHAPLDRELPPDEPNYKMFKATLTEEEARICTITPLGGATAEEIAAANGEDPVYIRKMLERTSYLGYTSFYTNDDGKRIYKQCIWVPGVSEHFLLIPEHQTPEIIQLWKDHTAYMSKRGATAGMGQALLRVLPINESIDAKAEIADWETIQNYLDQSDLYSAASCECRLAKRLTGEGCEHPVEDMCIQIGPEAEYYIKTGRGRQMTRAEVEAQLKKAEEAGLVHEVFVGMGKTKDGKVHSNFICNCCTCSCISLRAAVLYKNPDGSRSNFVARVDPDKCVGCGTCVEYCNSNAALLGSRLTKENQVPDYDKPYDTDWTPDHWNPNYRTRKVVNSFGTAPCKTACPAHISVQGYIRKAHEGKFDEALKLIKRDNPFPAVCGRVCPHDCEKECTRNKVDEAIAIDDIKKYIADKELQSEHRYVPEIKQKFPGKLAVIGGGPAGLSCAYYAAVDGFDVTVFEKERQPGGMMTMGIPNFRLEKDVINAEIDVLRKLGVKFETSCEVGQDKTIPQLRFEGYNAFFISVGLQACGKLGVPGDDLSAVIPGFEFMKFVNTGNDPKLSDRVVVIGGGNIACDTARTAIRNGAKHVDMYCLEAAEDMPCGPQDREEVIEDGIKIHNGWGVQEVLGVNGKVIGIRFKKCVQVKDAEGKFAPVYDENIVEEAECGTVLYSIGQRPLWGQLLEGSRVEFNPDGTVKADPVSYQTAEPDIFVGGDCLTGQKFVITAIATGKNASVSIRRFLKGLHLTYGRERDFHAIDKSVLDLAGYDQAPRQRIAKKNGAVNLTDEQIMAETARCLGCGVSVVDEYQCFGCGVCASKCEFDAIKLYRNNDLEPADTPQDWVKRIQIYQKERAQRIAAKKMTQTNQPQN